jgi:hypothetical protein
MAAWISIAMSTKLPVSLLWTTGMYSIENRIWDGSNEDNNGKKRWYLELGMVLPSKKVYFFIKDNTRQSSL